MLYVDPSTPMPPPVDIFYQVPSQTPCPSCGYCPTCGRSTHYSQPYQPPWWPDHRPFLYGCTMAWEATTATDLDSPNQETPK